MSPDPRHELRRLLARLWPPLLVGCLLSLVIAGIGVAVEPLALRWLIDQGLGEGNTTAVVGALALAFGGGLLLRALMFAQHLVLARTINTGIETVTDRALTAYYRLPFSRVVAEDDGYHLTRVYDEPAQLVTQGVVLVDQAVSLCATTLMAFIFAVFLSWEVTLLLLAAVGPLVWLSRRMQDRMLGEASVEQDREAAVRSVVRRAVSAYRSVRLFELGAFARRDVGDALRPYLAQRLRREKTGAGYQFGSGTCLSAAEALTLGVAAYQVVAGNLSIGGLLAFTTVFWRAMHGVGAMAALLPAAAVSWTHLRRVAELVAGEETTERLPDDQTAGKLPSHDLHIDAEGVGYGGEVVLPRVELAIAAGQRVLVTGENGSGKTTLAHLVAGLTLEGRCRRRAPATVSAMLAPLRFTIGHLRAQLERVAGRALEHHDLELLSDFGLLSSLDRDPESCSEGQKRKAATAMALLRAADLYVLDEPLAGVDEASKSGVMRHIEERTRGKTLVAVMHGDREHLWFFDRQLALDSPASAE